MFLYIVKSLLALSAPSADAPGQFVAGVVAASDAPTAKNVVAGKVVFRWADPVLVDTDYAEIGFGNLSAAKIGTFESVGQGIISCLVAH